MDLSSYKTKIGLIEPEVTIETKVRSEKRYLTIIQYLEPDNKYKIHKYIGTHGKAITDPKKSFELAKEDILSKKLHTSKDGALSVIVVEQTWATVKTNHDILSVEEYAFQPIMSRWLSWDEIKMLCF